MYIMCPDHILSTLNSTLCLPSSKYLPPTPSHFHVQIHVVCWNIDWFCLITDLVWVTLTAWSSWVQWVISRRQYSSLLPVLQLLHSFHPLFWDISHASLRMILMDPGLSLLWPLILTPGAIMSHCTNCWLLHKSSANVWA